MFPGKPAEDAAAKVVGAWATLEKQDDVADALVQSHKGISVMGKNSDIHEEELD